MQKFREENIKQRLEYLNKEKQMLNEFEIQPMLEEWLQIVRTFQYLIVSEN